jgi:hypothetical protein
MRSGVNHRDKSLHHLVQFPSKAILDFLFIIAGILNKLEEPIKRTIIRHSDKQITEDLWSTYTPTWTNWNRAPLRSPCCSLRWAASDNLSNALIAIKGEAPLTELFVFLAAALRIWATVLKSEDEPEGLLCVSAEAEGVDPEIVTASGIWNIALGSRYEGADVVPLCAIGEDEDATEP